MSKYPSHREQLGQWLNDNGLLGEMVEVGVCYGGFAKVVLNQWKGKTYHMVDLWKNQPVEVYKEKQDAPEIYEARYNECVQMAEKDSRIKIWRTHSCNAAYCMKDGSMDCVYIDANHCREAVESDLNAWWPKMKTGGLFCGHDFNNKKVDGNWCDVEDVVREFAGKNQLELHSTPCTSWWIRK